MGEDNPLLQTLDQGATIAVPSGTEGIDGFNVSFTDNFDEFMTILRRGDVPYLIGFQPEEVGDPIDRTPFIKPLQDATSALNTAQVSARRRMNEAEQLALQTAEEEAMRVADRERKRLALHALGPTLFRAATRSQGREDFRGAQNRVFQAETVLDRARSSRRQAQARSAADLEAFQLETDARTNVALADMDARIQMEDFASNIQREREVKARNMNRQLQMLVNTGQLSLNLAQDIMKRELEAMRYKDAQELADYDSKTRRINANANLTNAQARSAAGTASKFKFPANKSHLLSGVLSGTPNATIRTRAQPAIKKLLTEMNRAAKESFTGTDDLNATYQDLGSVLKQYDIDKPSKVRDMVDALREEWVESYQQFKALHDSGAITKAAFDNVANQYEAELQFLEGLAGLVSIVGDEGESFDTFVNRKQIGSDAGTHNEQIKEFLDQMYDGINPTKPTINTPGKGEVNTPDFTPGSALIELGFEETQFE